MQSKHNLLRLPEWQTFVRQIQLTINDHAEKALQCAVDGKPYEAAGEAGAALALREAISPELLDRLFSEDKNA